MVLKNENVKVARAAYRVGHRDHIVNIACRDKLCTLHAAASALASDRTRNAVRWDKVIVSRRPFPRFT